MAVFLNRERILADEGCADVRDGSGQRLLLVLERSFADAGQPCVGLHKNKNPVGAKAVDDLCPDIRDAHSHSSRRFLPP